MKHICLLVFTASFMFVFATLLPAAEQLPEKTEDGLVLQSQSKLTGVYLKPGSSIQEYDKVLLKPAEVAFVKNYMRDYNSNVGPNIQARLTKSDMKRMRESVSSEFNRIFTKNLEKAGYTVVTEEGEKVMLIKPAIVNLDVAAPDTQRAFSGASFITSAGSLTLYADLYDSVSNAKFATVIDIKEAGEGVARRASRVSNKADLDAVLGYWAELLVKRLDEAHGKSE